MKIYQIGQFVKTNPKQTKNKPNQTQFSQGQNQLQ